MPYVLNPEELETRETYDALADRYNEINSAHWKGTPLGIRLFLV